MSFTMPINASNELRGENNERRTLLSLPLPVRNSHSAVVTWSPQEQYMSHIAKDAPRHAHHGCMLRFPRSAILFFAFFVRTAPAVTPVALVNVPVVYAVATGLLRGHIWEGKVSHNNKGAGRCLVWRARATSVLVVAISGRRPGRKRHGASPALCGQRPQIDQKALPNIWAVQISFSDLRASRRALTGRGGSRRVIAAFTAVKVALTCGYYWSTHIDVGRWFHLCGEL